MVDTSVVLWVGRSDSQCGACGQPASLSEKTHEFGAWGTKGCGATFTVRQAMYIQDQEYYDMFNWTDMSKPFFKEESMNLPFEDL